VTTHTLHREVWVPRPLPQTFDFFSRAENLEQITPPWVRFRILNPKPIVMKEGITIGYSLRIHGIPLRWLTAIEHWDPPHEFIDVQVKGPYRLWRHTHRFSAVEGGTCISDIVQYSLPLGPLGLWVHRVLVAHDLESIFDYRARQVQALLS